MPRRVPMYKRVKAMECGEWFLVGGRDYVAARYVYLKTERLQAWLDAQGEAVRYRLYEAHYGTRHGYEVYQATVAAVEKVCRYRGVTCDAMLCAGLIGLEGERLVVRMNTGKRARGVLRRAGKYIEFHTMIKGDNKHGARLRPWEFEAVE